MNIFRNKHSHLFPLCPLLPGEKGVTEIHFCGLASDICVYYSILDAVLEGFSATLIEDASMPLYPEKFDAIKCEIAKKGVHIITSGNICMK